LDNPVPSLSHRRGRVGRGRRDGLHRRSGRPDEGRSRAMIASVLSLAAAPTFAVMALLTGLSGGGADMLCSAMHASPLGGMMPMYLLMSAFHLAPWLRLIGRHSITKP